MPGPDLRPARGKGLVAATHAHRHPHSFGGLGRKQTHCPGPKLTRVARDSPTWLCEHGRLLGTARGLPCSAASQKQPHRNVACETWGAGRWVPSLQDPPAVWAARREQQVWLRLWGRAPRGLAEARLPWQGLADPVEHRSRGLRGGGESCGPCGPGHVRSEMREAGMRMGTGWVGRIGWEGSARGYLGRGDRL